jgi:hypothetical protein
MVHRVMSGEMERPSRFAALRGLPGGFFASSVSLRVVGLLLVVVVLLITGAGPPV